MSERVLKHNVCNHVVPNVSWLDKDAAFYLQLEPSRLQFWKKGKDPRPQDKIQHLDFTKDPRPLYYKTPPCAFYHKNVRSEAIFGL